MPPPPDSREGEDMPAKGAGMVRRDGLVLAIIDIQDKLAATMERRDEVAATAARLVAAAAVLGVPIVSTRQYPAGLGETVEDVAAALEAAAAATTVTVIDKTAFCACEEPAFLAVFDKSARRQAVLAGMETHICVTQTALALHARGVEVFAAADACCSRRQLDHEVALDRLRSCGVVVTTSESVMYEAVARAGTDDFRRLLTIVKGG